MHHLAQQAARLGMALALTCSTLTAQATLIENHLLVSSLQGTLPSGYEQGYSLRLGTGSWPYPSIDLFVDNAEGKSSYASISARKSYLTYIQSVYIAQVKAGDEISARTLHDGSLPSFVRLKAYSYEHPELNEDIQVQPLISITGADPEIYLGFSYTDIYGLNPTYGWAHLRYTQDAGLSLVSSAMTMSDVGIFALTRTTISPVPETSISAMLGLGLLSIAGLQAARCRQLIRRY